MIACLPRSATIYYRTASTSSATDVTDGYDTTCLVVYVASDNGWYEISSDAMVWVVTEAKEPARKPDEPNTGRRVPVTWERPHRRLATVTRTRRVNKPRKASSSWG